MPAGDQVGVGSAAGPGQSFGIHNHNSDPQGGTLSPAEDHYPPPPDQPLRPRAFDYPLMGIFGDGSDGDEEVAGLTQLSKDMNYRNLHVQSTGVLYTAGFIWRVFGKVTVDPGGVICCDGFDGVDGDIGAPGNGGPGGFGAIVGPKLRDMGITDGGFWARCNGALGGSANGLGKNTSTGTPTVSSLMGWGYPFGKHWQAMGGGAGAGIGLTPTPGGTLIRTFYGTSTAAGGDSKIVGAGVNVQDGGGGGGGGAGPMEFWANEIDNAGRITCRGGKGGAGHHTVVGADESYSGNGNGGNGGILRAFYRKISGAGLGVIDCAGGPGGVGGWGGGPGPAGYFEAIQVGA